LISRRKKGYATGVTQLKLMPHVEQLLQMVQNQYLVRIPTSGLEQLVHVTRGVHVQQIMTMTLPINVHVTTGLLVYSNGVPIQQPIKANSYP
jgi:hypothetical protein